MLLQTFPADGVNYAGIAYLDGKIYATDLFSGSIDIFDASSLSYESTISSVGGLSGLAGDPDRGVLWGVSQGFPGNLYEIDPATGSVLNQAPLSDAGYEQDLAYANGMLIVSDTAGFGAGNNFLDYYDPTSLTHLQRLPVAAQGYVSGLGGDGIGGVSTDWYQFNVNAGDNLVLSTTTPGGSSANGLQFINDLAPTINLYDEAGNLVATATGNAGDGRNDVIDWTALSSGSYRVQILGSDKTNLGEYTIAVQGATGGQYPFQVTSTNPADGSDLNYQPATMTVTFDNSILFSSVDTSDFQIDGQDATGVTVVDSHTLSFGLPALADGVHSVAIHDIIDIHGVTLTPYDLSFTTDTTPPYIVSSSLADGSVFSPAPATVTEVLTFSEPMNTSLTPSVDLIGEVRGIDYGTGTDTWDPTGTILTIVYNNLPSDAYQFNVYTYGFQDLAGNQLLSGLTTNFSVVAGTTDITGLSPILPLGSLVYQGTVDNVLIDSNQVDAYNLAIDPQQTLAVIVKPVTKTMTATVELYSPAGKLIGTATSPSPGARPSSTASRAPRGAPTNSRSAADRANTRSSRSSTRTSIPRPTAALPTAPSPRPSRSIPTPTSSSATTTAPRSWVASPAEAGVAATACSRPTDSRRGSTA